MSRFRFLVVWAVLLAALPAMAQIMTPVKWSQKIVMKGDDKGEVVFTATIAPGWHMYSNDVDPNIGPSPLSISFPTLKGVKLNGGLRPSAKPHVQYDDMFEAELRWWTNSVSISQRFTATEPDFKIAGNISFSACNDQNCIPPSKESFSLSGKAKIKADKAKEVDEADAKAADTAEVPARADSVAATDTVAAAVAPAVAIPSDSAVITDLWAPATAEVQQAESQ